MTAPQPTADPTPAVLPAFAFADSAATVDNILDVLDRWHYETHLGSSRLCYQSPCREIHGVTRGPQL